MKTLFLAIIAIAIVGIGAYFLFPWLGPYASQTRGDVDKAIAGRVSDESVVAGAEDEISAKADDLRNLWVGLSTQKEKLAGFQAELARQQKDLGNRETNIREATAWIESHGVQDRVTRSGREYTYEQVVQDTATQVDVCKGLRDSIVSLTESYSTMQNSIAQGEKSVQTAVATLESARAKLNAKGAVLGALRAAQTADEEAAKLAESITSGSLTLTEANDRYLKELNSRIATIRAQREFSSMASNQTGGIPWTQPESGPVAPSQVSLDEIRGYVSEHMAPAPEATVSTSEAPAPAAAQ